MFLQVEKFAADECNDQAEHDEAQARLAIRLGAKQKKNAFMNYKELKAKLKSKKNEVLETDKLAASKVLEKIKNRKKNKNDKRHKKMNK